MKYFLIGPYPPPYGGVSVYIYRFIRTIDRRRYRVELMDLFKMSRRRRYLAYLKLFLWPGKAVYHLDTFENKDRLARLLLARPFKSRIILHNYSCRYLETLSGSRRELFRRFLEAVDECILVGAHLRNAYAAAGFELPANTRVLPCFLPPPLEEEAGIWATYGPDTRSFTGSRRPLITANAGTIRFYRGEDLYGLDMCVELVARLKPDYPEVGMLFALADPGDQKYFLEINRRIDRLGLRENFHFLTGQKELWPLFRKADLMVRPTNTDGYGASIAEALYFNCPAVASNVGMRPEHTILFRSRDHDDFYRKCRQVLEERIGN